jgi:16S rRNA G527 N7-methylase RsmG
MINTIPIETLRELFINYQSQFYNENEMYNLIAQSDQSQAIKRGSYDEHILKNFTIKNGGLIKQQEQ